MQTDQQQPQIAPQPYVTPVTQVAPGGKSLMPILIVIAVLIVVAAAVFYTMNLSTGRQQAAVAPTPTPTTIPTPTPVRVQSALAGNAQFQQFAASVATLSAAIAGYSPQDPSLTPPTLDLPLGFSQN